MSGVLIASFVLDLFFPLLHYRAKRGKFFALTYQGAATAAPREIQSFRVGVPAVQNGVGCFMTEAGRRLGRVDNFRFSLFSFGDLEDSAGLGLTLLLCGGADSGLLQYLICRFLLYIGTLVTTVF